MGWAPSDYVTESHSVCVFTLRGNKHQTSQVEAAEPGRDGGLVRAAPPHPSLNLQ